MPQHDEQVADEDVWVLYLIPSFALDHQTTTYAKGLAVRLGLADQPKYVIGVYDDATSMDLWSYLYVESCGKHRVIQLQDSVLQGSSVLAERLTASDIDMNTRMAVIVDESVLHQFEEWAGVMPSVVHPGMVVSFYLTAAGHISFASYYAPISM